MTKSHYWRNAPDSEFAVVGDPVGHSWSPAMQNAALKELGRHESYTAIQVPLEEFDEALGDLRSRGFVGVNCTVPLKEAALNWAASPDSEARRFGAVNTLRLTDRSGTNTDATGFMDTLADLGVTPADPVLMIGAGGTARALLVALRDTGFSISLYNRTRSRAEQICAELEVFAEILDHPAIGDRRLVINATSAGLSGDPIDIAWGNPGNSVIAYDLLYGTEPSPFLRDAQRAGLKTVDGRHMLVAQGARSLEWWLGLDAPRATMLAALP